MWLKGGDDLDEQADSNQRFPRTEQRPHVITIPASGPVRTRKLRVAAYARVSSDSEDQLHSFAAQNTYYTEPITGNPEWEFVDVYADQGITGTSAEKRDDFQRLLKDCRRGRIDKVLTKSTARFARNTSESLMAVRELRDLGGGVCFEEQGIDTAQMSGELLTAIFSMIAQKESEAISENIRWSIRNRKENGTFTATSLPFGYIRDETGEIKVDLQRAGYVKEIFEAFLGGRNTKEIAEEMKRRQETEKPLQSYQWTVHAIARILKNEKYTGNSLWQKSFKTQTLPHRYKVNKGEYYAKDTHPPIISCSVYDKAQELLRIRKEQFHPQGMVRSHLSGCIECGCCGSNFRKIQHGGKVYHACRVHTVDRKKCPTKQIPESEFRNAFLRLYYKLRHRGIPVLSQLLTDLQTAQNGKLLWSRDIVELNRQIADIVRQERLLAELKQQGLVDPDVYVTRINTLAEQLRTVKPEKERFLESEEDQTIRQTQILLEVLENGPEFLEAFDEELFSELVAKIIVENNGCLRFRLINGLELTEAIERTVR
mgnify:CR=1 FL=1